MISNVAASGVPRRSPPAAAAIPARVLAAQPGETVLDLGSGGGFLGDRPVAFNLLANVLYQEIKFRLGSSDFM